MMKYDDLTILILKTETGYWKYINYIQQNYPGSKIISSLFLRGKFFHSTTTQNAVWAIISSVSSYKRARFVVRYLDASWIASWTISEVAQHVFSMMQHLPEKFTSLDYYFFHLPFTIFYFFFSIRFLPSVFFSISPLSLFSEWLTIGGIEKKRNKSARFLSRLPARMEFCSFACVWHVSTVFARLLMLAAK